MLLGLSGTRWPTALAVIAVVLWSAWLLHLAARTGVTFDEPAYIGAGWSYWQTRDFATLNAEHPPLSKLLSTLPLRITSKLGGAASGYKMSRAHFEAGSAYAVGVQLIWHNHGSRLLLLFSLAFSWRPDTDPEQHPQGSAVLFAARVPTVIQSACLALLVWSALLLSLAAIR